MSYSPSQDTGSAIAGPYTVGFPYINKTHVEVRVDGVLKTVTTHYTWPTDSTIQFTTGNFPGNGAAIDISRNSSQASRVVDWQDAAGLTEAAMDLADNQLFYMAQEALYAAASKMAEGATFQWDAESKRILNVADGVLGQDAVTMAQLGAYAQGLAPAGTLGIANGGTGQVTAPAALAALGGIDAATLAAAVVAAGNSYRRRNRFINPAMRHDQINAGANYTVNSASLSLMDAWTGIGVSAAGVFTVARELGGIATGVYNLIATVTTVDSSLAAADRYGLLTAIEGYDIADLYVGTSSSEYVTLEFDVKSSITGTFSCHLGNSATNRSYPSQFTVNAANTVERKTLTIRLDQSGTWLKDNGVGLYFGIMFGAGSNFNGTLNTWAAGDFRHVSGSTNFMATNGATMRLGNFDLHMGQTSRTFEPPAYAEDLALVQRYYHTGTMILDAAINPTTGVKQLSDRYPVDMRATPTIVQTNVSGAPTVAPINHNTLNAYSVDNTVAMSFNYTANARLT